LLRLFAVIDQGERDLNVPLYNGGLFLTHPDGGDDSPEAENARFLLLHRIPDRYLALGLDRLTRDIDDRRQSLVFIDYKSMGVRQLGSIYEGLLEFRVRVAPEQMAVVQGKKTEEVVPYTEAIAEKRKILTRGRGLTAQQRVYQTGDVYLENDRRERKATGSYYTPDHIVKYIVEHAVGPVLVERLEKLRPRFREAQQSYHKKLANAAAFRRHGIEPDDPAKVAISYEPLVDELFDLRVLDPAMGSGHFLVEAVDFICDHIIGQKDGFLQAFPWNPVTVFLGKTRAAILSEMERQGVSIDTSRLTDINLLKRHVLKRCIYGVDLNPMAVELAKVSLWLDCFTLGAPLSFLDHHLKCGNSLIGTTVQEVDSSLQTKEKQTYGMFGGVFQGMLAATAQMDELRRIPDATVEQAVRSRDLFADIEEHLAPYKRALDVWVSEDFGNSESRYYLTHVVRDFAEEWRTGGSGLLPVYQRVLQKATALGRKKHFFHWDLEFPEAFIDTSNSMWKDREERGFHSVVGNPPWTMAGLQAEDDGVYLRENFRAATGKFDVYYVFIEESLELITANGRCGMIVPNKFFHTKAAEGLRNLLAESRAIASITDFCESQLFLDATNYSCLIFLQKVPTVGVIYSTSDAHLVRHDDLRIPWNSLQAATWQFNDKPLRDLFLRMEAVGESLESMTRRFGTGVQSGLDRVFMMAAQEAEALHLEGSVLRPIIRGRNIDRYALVGPLCSLIFPYTVDCGEFAILPESLLKHYSRVYDLLLQNRVSLLHRTWFGKGPIALSGSWYGMMYLDGHSSFASRHILTPSLSNRSRFALGTGDLFVTGTAGVTSIILEENIPEDILYILAVLNSALLSLYVVRHSPVFSGGYHKFSAPYLRKVPIRRIDFSSAADKSVHDQIVALAQRLVDLNSCRQQRQESESQSQESAVLDGQLDQLVCHLYGLNEEDTRIVEVANQALGSASRV
jgi:hypothetical protein